VAAWFLAAAAPQSGSWTLYFQENCLACRRQLRELSCLEEQGWDIHLVGVGESRVRLRHELSRVTQKSIEFKSLSWSDARTEGINGTPFHVRQYKDGRQERFYGLLQCQQF
jgi:hypothetical protein